VRVPDEDALSSCGARIGLADLTMKDVSHDRN
jgi:hypothetical protein